MTLKECPGTIVFDIDGTLADSVKAHQIAFEAALRHLEFPTLRTDWASYAHHTDSAILIEAWANAGFPGQPDLAAFERDFAWRYDQQVSAEPFVEISGARHYIDVLRTHGWVVVFATGSLRHGALHKLSVLGIDGHVEVLSTATEWLTREEIVRDAVTRGCKLHGVETSKRVISIGDGIWDLKTANHLGYEFIGIGSGSKGAALERAGARVFQDFRNLMSEAGGGPNLNMSVLGVA